MGTHASCLLSGGLPWKPAEPPWDSNMICVKAQLCSSTNTRKRVFQKNLLFIMRGCRLQICLESAHLREGGRNDFILPLSQHRTLWCVIALPFLLNPKGPHYIPLGTYELAWWALFVSWFFYRPRSWSLFRVSVTCRRTLSSGSELEF